MEWKHYSSKETIKLKGLSKKIVQDFGINLSSFYSLQVRPERTRFIKKQLVKIGHSLKYKVYANGLNDDDLKEINQPFINHEWLFDIHYYTEGEIGYSVRSMPLVAECEWKAKRKGDSKISYSGVKYDFQKLVVSNAKLKLMIFKLLKPTDLIELKEYFEYVIFNYKHLEKDAQFLFVAFDEKVKSFHYLMICK